MSPLVDLRIDAVIDGKDAAFAEALAAREQHWAGAAGKGGDVRPESRLTLHKVMMDRGGEMCDRLMSERGWGEADFRHAASRFEETGDPDLRVLAAHLRAFEMFASEESQKEMTRSMNAMTEALIAGQSEEYLREQRTAVRNQDSPDQHSRTSGPLGYPVGVKPVAEEVDREMRGAREAPMSAKLRSLAQEVRAMSRLSSSPRQKARLVRSAAELERMAVRQYEREGASEVVPAGDPDEPNNAMSRLASDMRDEARASGAQDDDSFRSFDDWDTDPRQGSDGAIADDVRDQLLLDEDLPRVPAPGRRYAGEDQTGDPAAGTDEPAGARKNAADDDLFQRLRKGKVPADAGQPRGDDRYGYRVRYSGLKRESIREAADLTQALLDDQWAWYHAGRSHF